MKGLLALTLLVAFAGALAGCGATPEPTEPPPTQTPWIVVITATPRPGELADLEPSQTPWIIVATATRRSRATATSAAPTLSTDSPPATQAPLQTMTAAAGPTAPGRTPVPVEVKYPAPALLEPPDGRPVSWKSTVLLKWSSVGTLARDEYYHLHLERRPEASGQDWYGDYVFTKDTQYLAEGSFLAPFHPPEEYGQGIVYWWVRVVRRTGVNQDGKPVGIDVGEYSKERTLILDAKPERD